MNKIYTLLVTLVFSLPLVLVGASQLAGAAALDPLADACAQRAGGGASSVCDDSASVDPNNSPITGTNGVILRAANILAVVASIISVIILIIVGISYMLSSGDSGKLRTYRDAIIYTLIGLTAIVVSRTLIVFIINRL